MILDLDRILDFQHLFLWKIEEEILTVYFLKFGYIIRLPFYASRISGIPDVTSTACMSRKSVTGITFNISSRSG